MPLFIFPQFPELCAGTTIRSEGNFGMGKSIDEAGKVLAGQNRQKLLQNLGLHRLNTAWQTHSSIVLSACGNSLREADALITNKPGELLAVHTADCIPVFFYAPKQRAVGLAHSGRRGLLKGISSKVLAALHQAYGADPSDIFVHIGPHISAASYEVGEEVFQEFGISCEGAKGLLDMQGILIGRLLKEGVERSNIYTSNKCTLAAKDEKGLPLFFSYRGGDTGQILSFLGIR